MLLSVYINEKLYFLNENVSILEACNSLGIKVPRFCYHENLSIAGNCRMCLVEIEKSIKPIVACSTDLQSGMIIYTNSPLVLKSRENILEFLLLNHPLDCPICDQGGECDLQDQAIFFGSNFSRNFFFKRSVEDKLYNSLIKTIMNRCIHCTRCIRFGEEVCGSKFFGTLSRGKKTEIGNYINSLAISEISVNVVDLCPVGALTLKIVPFQTRPWELLSLESIDLTDCVGSNIYLLYKGLNILKVVPKKNIQINDSWISNKSRYYFNVTFQNSKPNLTLLSVLKFPILFLINSDLALNTLALLKKKTHKAFKITAKLLNSTIIKTNFYFWGGKSKISTISSLKSGICFLISSNLQIEATVLNIKLRSKVQLGNLLAYSFSNFKSNFPVRFTKFSTLDIVLLILGKHFFLSNFFFNCNLLFFSNKSIVDRLDIFFFNFLNYKIPQNLFFNIASFCNTEGANYLNFQKFNLKEYLWSKKIFGLNLDDTFILRKLLSFNRNFVWVNQFPSNLLNIFKTLPAWISLSLNQSPGYYLNVEQRVQTMALLKKNYKMTMESFLSNAFFSQDIVKPVLNFFLSFNFQLSFLKFNYLVEVAVTPSIFQSITYKFSFFNSLFLFNYCYSYKLSPIKSIMEDHYRTSLQIKYSVPLIKSSQKFRYATIF